MKTFTVIAIFTVVISYVKGEYSAYLIEHNLHNDIPELVRRYCALSVEGREKYRFCSHENGVHEHLELARNCVQQQRIALTYEDRDKFLCHTRTEHEFQKFLKCYVPALTAESRDDIKMFPVIRKCMSREENRGLKTGHHIYHGYIDNIKSTENVEHW